MTTQAAIDVISTSRDYVSISLIYRLALEQYGLRYTTGEMLCADCKVNLFSPDCKDPSPVDYEL